MNIAIKYFLIFYLWLIKRTCRINVSYCEGSKELICHNAPGIYACWHSRFMIFFILNNIGKFQAIASSHKDASVLQDILQHYHHKVISGSSRRGAFSAMKNILKISSKDMRLFVTPDGPIGPKFKIKGSLVKIAQKYALPILPMSYSASYAIVLPSWDSFIIPIPFISKIIIHFEKPIDPLNISEQELEDIMVLQVKDLDLQAKIYNKVHAK